MAYELLLRRIDERLKILNLSERKACLQAEVGVNTIRHIRKRGHAPKIAALVKLSKVLQVPAEYLTDAAAQGEIERESGQSERVMIIGSVQAGVWKAALEWNPEEWRVLPVPADARFPGVTRYGLKVVGPSMNKVYPEGTIVIVVSFGELGRTPLSGERVIAMRRDETGQYEATVKEYELAPDGRHILWPKSTDPEFQTPVVISAKVLPLAEQDGPFPQSAYAGLDGHTTGEPDLVITALVVGSYRVE